MTDLKRVKLPKSFLAVNLSETHTFHKKEDPNSPTKIKEAKQSEEVETAVGPTDPVPEVPDGTT